MHAGCGLACRARSAPRYITRRVSGSNYSTRRLHRPASAGVAMPMRLPYNFTPEDCRYSAAKNLSDISMIALRALRHRNFSLFIAGQVWALIGYWIQQLAVSWLVYRLTGSATLLGVLSFA